MWPKRPYRWTENNREHISIPFTWNLPQVRKEILNGNLFTGHPIVGGPAVQLMPDYLADIAEIGSHFPGVLQMVNPMATRTTEGCPHKCAFCGIGQGLIEAGPYRELDEFPIGPIVCDNNLLAASQAHFDFVVSTLKRFAPYPVPVDFNQGLDARLMTQRHADRLAELDCTIRLAWDHINEERAILRAVNMLRKAKIPRDRIRCYVLIGFNDSPEDAMYRFETLRYSLNILPNPMRYNPLNALERDIYVAPGWTDEELHKMAKYWSRSRHLAGIPYDEFDYTR